MLDISERRVCSVLGQHRSTQRKVLCGADDEEAPTDDIIALAKQYGRYGYRRVTALLHAAGWSVKGAAQPRAAIFAPQRRSIVSSSPITTGPAGTNVATNRKRSSLAAVSVDHRLRLRTS